METKVVKPEETRIFMEGQEVDREYFHTDKLVFGTSELMPGQTGAVDPGHAIPHEVFYVVRGTVLLRCGDRLYELKEGMAQIIPPTMPHQLTNIGDCKCIVSWSLAPGE